MLTRLYRIVAEEPKTKHVVCGLATVTLDGDGEVFDWQQVTRGLFRVCWAKGHKRPAGAHPVPAPQGNPPGQSKVPRRTRAATLK